MHNLSKPSDKEDLSELPLSFMKAVSFANTAMIGAVASENSADKPILKYGGAYHK